MGIRLMIIELGKYNEIRELLIENRITELQVHICYWDRDRRVSVTGAAVYMEEEGTGMRIGHRNAYNQALSWEWGQAPVGPLQSNQRSISMK